MPNQLLERLEQCFCLAEAHFKRSFKRPSVNLKLRGSKAGVAYLQANELRFNAELYQNNREDFLRQVVAHEVAHLLVFQMHGRSAQAHGAQWAQLMSGLYGLEPKVRHSYKVTPRVQLRYRYRCACPEQNVHAFTGQRHAYVCKGHRYLCQRCKAPLHFTGELERS